MAMLELLAHSHSLDIYRLSYGEDIALFTARLVEFD